MMRQFTESIVEQTALSAIRNALLPKLLSGEIMIKDAKKFMEQSL